MPFQALRHSMLTRFAPAFHVRPHFNLFPVNLRGTFYFSNSPLANPMRGNFRSNYSIQSEPIHQRGRSCVVSLAVPLVLALQAFTSQSFLALTPTTG
eukprot:scaffold4368_cov180-Ochromonas_danica.AAC.15